MAQMDEVRPEAIASGFNEARQLFASGEFARVRLGWNISSDQFFTLAAEFKEKENINILRDERGFYLERRPMPKAHA